MDVGYRCSDLGKKPESVASSIQEAFDDAAWHEPSAVFLDDLDQIVKACSGPDQEMSGEALYHGKIAQRMFLRNSTRADCTFLRLKAHSHCLCCKENRQ